MIGKIAKLPAAVAAILLASTAFASAKTVCYVTAADSHAYATPANVAIKLSEFEIRLTEFQTSRFVELVDKTATIVDEADREQIPKLLNALGSLDLGLIQRTMSFLTIANDIVSQAEPRVTLQESVRGQSDPNAVAAEITSLLEGVSGRPHVAAEAAV